MEAATNVRHLTVRKAELSLGVTSQCREHGQAGNGRISLRETHFDRRLETQGSEPTKRRGATGLVCFAHPKSRLQHAIIYTSEGSKYTEHRDLNQVAREAIVKLIGYAKAAFRMILAKRQYFLAPQDQYVKERGKYIVDLTCKPKNNIHFYSV